MSQNNINELVERYLYDVTRRLPEKQKKDIEEELRTLIEDMVAEYEDNGKAEEENIKTVLEELGDPAMLALKYRDGSNHLIGGVYYPLYCLVLKIVLICVGISVVLSSVIGFFVTANGSDVDVLFTSLQNGVINFATIIDALLSAFGSATLVFFLMERKQVSVKDVVPEWSISKLPPVPTKKARIPRSDSILGVVFGLLCVCILIFAPELAGAWVRNNATGEVVAISVFNIPMWSRILPLIVITFGCSIVDDFVKLVVGCYNKTVMYVSIFCSIVNVIVTCYLFCIYDVFNPSFVADISLVTGTEFSAKADLLVYWNTGIGGVMLDKYFMGLICVITLIELAVTVYRTLRYGKVNSANPV